MDQLHEESPLSRQEQELQMFLKDKPFLNGLLHPQEGEYPFAAAEQESKNIEQGMPEPFRNALAETANFGAIALAQYDAFNTSLSRTEMAAALKQLVITGYSMGSINNFLRYGEMLMPRILDAYKKTGMLDQAHYEKHQAAIDNLLESVILYGAQATVNMNVESSEKPENNVPLLRNHATVSTEQQTAPLIEHTTNQHEETATINTIRNSIRAELAIGDPHAHRVLDPDAPNLQRDDKQPDSPRNVPKGLTEPVKRYLGISD